MGAGPHRIPGAHGAIAHLECELEAVHPGGDHDIVICGPVIAGEDSSPAPPLSFRSTYGTFEG
ncbi:flavin reductase family protein [Dactylosporangium sp. NPDC051484]|uniref:flavin reductase family protein n=1 Tax=Dactylosporangium sp. NPDC051484 TaxID=3154942 RepID=UPI00344DC70E